MSGPVSAMPTSSHMDAIAGSARGRGVGEMEYIFIHQNSYTAARM